MNISLARSSIYNLFSIFYGPPDEEIGPFLTGEIWKRQMREAFSVILEDGMEGVKCLEELRSEETPQEITGEYLRLFEGSGLPAVAPPYGAAYMYGEIPTVGEAAYLLNYYREQGFILKGRIKASDHLVHKMAFMGVLAERAAALDGNEKIMTEEKQMEFFARFLLPWLPLFCSRISAHARLSFYRVLSDLTMDFINFEKNYLGVPEELNSATGG